MKKVIYIIAAMLISFSALSAQNIWSLQYSVGIPHGDTKEYADNTSGRGFIVEGKGFVTQKVTFGGFMAWNVFTEEVIGDHIDLGDLDIFGNTYRYINVMPLMASMSYYPNHGHKKAFNPFASIGVGTIFQEQKTDIGTNTIYADGWMFGLAPEVGISYTLPGGFDLIVNYKYMLGLETTQVSQLSYSNLNIGMGVTF